MFFTLHNNQKGKKKHPNYWFLQLSIWNNVQLTSQYSTNCSIIIVHPLVFHSHTRYCICTLSSMSLTLGGEHIIQAKNHCFISWRGKVPKGEHFSKFIRGTLLHNTMTSSALNVTSLTSITNQKHLLKVFQDTSSSYLHTF